MITPHLCPPFSLSVILSLQPFLCVPLTPSHVHCLFFIDYHGYIYTHANAKIYGQNLLTLLSVAYM